MNTLAFDRRVLARIGVFLALTAATLLSWQSAQAGSPNLIGGLALGGYDAVGYFESNDAIRGDSQYSYEWNGATWQFASAANRDTFAANPEAYAPQYDGYCAWAAARSYKANGDPEVWDIVDGKLYLNFSTRIQRRWEQDIPGFIAQADSVWPSVNP